MKELKRIICFGIYIAAFSYSQNQGPRHPERYIQVQPVLNLGKIQPSISRFDQFSVDKEDHVYFLEAGKHGILEYDQTGKFIKQIGRIGQDQEGLYQPRGLYVGNQRILVLNKAGKSIKAFSFEGHCLFEWDIEKSYISDSPIEDADGNIWANVRYRDPEQKDTFNDYPLITLIGPDGVIKRGVGKIIPCRNLVQYRVFNSCFLAISGRKILGGFKYFPIIFAYDLQGNEIFRKDLREFGLPEIQWLENKAREKGFDRPETPPKKEFGVQTVIYCRGISVDKNGHIYHVVNQYQDNNLGRGVIIHFDPLGNFLEKIFLKKGNADVGIIMGIWIDPKGRRFAVGYENKNWFLFNF